MKEKAKPDSTVGFTNDSRENAGEIVNDSLGTVDPADTADTDPDDDPEAGGKGAGEKMAE
jgi:hypothetical protein